MARLSLKTKITTNDLVVNNGTSANDKTGDPLRTAFDKLKESIDHAETNFVELYNSIASGGADLGDFSITGRTIEATTQGNVVLRALGPGGAPSAPPFEYDWTFTNGGRLQMPAGGDIVDSTGASVLESTAYTAAVPGDWDGTPPTTIQQAIDRIVAKLATEGIRP